MVQLLVDALDVERILADDRGREVAIDMELRAFGRLGIYAAAAARERRLTDARHAIIRLDPHKHVAERVRDVAREDVLGPQWNGEELRREARDLHEHPKSTIGWYCNAISYAVIAMRTMAREQVVSAERLRSFATAVLRTVGMPDDAVGRRDDPNCHQ